MSPGAGLSSVVVDGDGSGPRPPVTVLCGLQGGEAVTALGHDTEDKTKVDGFQAPGSFAQSIHYQVTSLTQYNTATLVNKSLKFCFSHTNCTLSPLAMISMRVSTWLQITR